MITLEKAIELLSNHKNTGKGKIFTVIFKKRTNGEIRTINCRFDVKSHLRGGELKYSPKEKNLMIVFDMQKQDYRSINLDSIIEIKVDGQTFKVEISV